MRGNMFYTNPRLTVLLVMFVVIMGSVAFLGLARQEDPTMTERWARVTTFMPGATAERMESMVSERIETALREVPEINELSSTSKAGLSQVSIEMYDSVSPEQVASIWSEIRDKLGDVSATLPVNASEPELTINKPLASTLIVALRWQQDSPLQINLLSRLAEAVRLRLANTPGTEIAESWGVAEEEILVSLNPFTLAEAHLTVAQVAESIRAADTKLPSGRLNSATSNLLVEVRAELDTPERIARIPVSVTDNGTSVQVADVATVAKSRMEPANSIAMHQGRQIVIGHSEFHTSNCITHPSVLLPVWTIRGDAVEVKSE